MFKDVKKGDTLYIYDRASITLSTEQVLKDPSPRVDKGGMVVDVEVGNMTYTFKDTSEIGFTPTLAISPSKSAILREVESQMANDKSLLSRIDSIKTELPKLEKIIDELNPEAKEKKLQKEEMASMKDDIKSLKEMVELLINAKPNGSK